MKKKLMGTNKRGPPISRTVVSPGDDPKHELVVLEIRRDTITSSDPDWNETEEIGYAQADLVEGVGTHRGYVRRLFKNGDTDYGSYEGTQKTMARNPMPVDPTAISTVHQTLLQPVPLKM
jgi:hypothetical protein